MPFLAFILVARVPVRLLCEFSLVVVVYKVLVEALGLFLLQLRESLLNLLDHLLEFFYLLFSQFLGLRLHILNQHLVIANDIHLLRLRDVLNLIDDVLFNFLFFLFLFCHVKIELAFDRVREATITLIFNDVLD